MVPSYALPAQSGVDWIAIARWITVGYGALMVVGLILLGLVVRQVTISSFDAETGRFVQQNVDLGIPMLIAAAFVAGVFALFAWLMQFSLFRVLMLVLTAAAALAAVSRIADGSTTVVFASLGSLLLDAAFCAVLVMSILARPQEQR
jgi:hypothetical protein